MYEDDEYMEGKFEQLESHKDLQACKRYGYPLTKKINLLVLRIVVSLLLKQGD